VEDLTARTFAQTIGAEESARLAFAPALCGVLSWNTHAPRGLLSFRLLRGESAGDWLEHARWDETGAESLSPHSGDARAEVDVIRSDRPFDGIEVRASGVRFELVAFCAPKRAAPSLPYARDALILDVPARSQYAPDWPRGWCSPASLAMIASFHGIDVPVEALAREVFDRAYDGTGNWSFNVACAGRYGLRGVVAHLRNLDQALSLVERNLPIAISYSWDEGELSGAPLPRSDGHLAVLCGFTAGGDCALNDPAAPNVRVVYPRASLERLWQRAGGVAYVIAPAGIEYASLLQ